MTKVQRLSQLKQLLFEEGGKLSKEIWVGRDWKPKLWSRGHWVFPLKNQSLTRFGRLIGGLIMSKEQSGMFLWVWTLDLAFENFTLYPAKDSTYYILLVNFNPFLWILNKVWPLNPTASRLGRP
jgi:hypothetical protein